jgi:hypothetical protein
LNYNTNAEKSGHNFHIDWQRMTGDAGFDADYDGNGGVGSDDATPQSFDSISVMFDGRSKGAVWCLKEYLLDCR